MTPPKETSSGRIGVVVAATALSAVMPFVTALEAFKPNAIVVSTASDAGGDERANDRFLSRDKSQIVDAAPASLSHGGAGGGGTGGYRGICGLATSRR